MNLTVSIKASVLKSRRSPTDVVCTALLKKQGHENTLLPSDLSFVCRAKLMDEIKLTRVGRYKIAWDRCDDIASRNTTEQADTEKLRRLSELGEQLKKSKKRGGQ